MSTFAAGLVGIVLILVLTYLGFTKAIPFRHHFTIKAAFHTSNNVKPNSFVRIAGVNVGKVTKIQPMKNDNGQPGAIVTMRIDKTGLPIHKDATATIRPRIFLEGNFFVDIRPGSPSSPPLGDADTLPVQQTSTPVQFDQILTTLQSGTRHDLALLLEEYSKALSGRGAAGYNRALPFFKPAYKGSAIVNDATLGLFQHDLSGYIKHAGVVAQALDRNPEALKSFITDFNTTAHSFAVQQANLSAAVAELPRTLRTGLPALRALDRAFPPLRRFVHDFRPAVRSSGPTLDASIPFVTQLRGLVSEPELRGLVADLVPTVPALAQLNNATVPLLEQVRTASSCQNQVILPWSHDTISDPNFPAKGSVYQEAPKFLPGIAGESRSFDANGLPFRVLLNTGAYVYSTQNNQFFSTANPIGGTNPPPPSSRPPLRTDVPCETQSPPDLHTEVAPGPTQVKTDANAPAVKAAWEQGKARLIAFAKAELKRAGLDHTIKVSDHEATQATVDALRATRARNHSTDLKK